MTAGMLTAMIEPHTGTNLGHHELEAMSLSVTLLSILLLLMM